MASGFRVYLLDDDTAHAAAVVRALGADGHAVLAFATAEQWFRCEPEPEAACLIAEPAVCGAGLHLFDALESAGLQVPTIFLARHGDVAHCARAMRRGAVDYFTKPAPAQELREAVRRAEALSRAWRDARAQRTLVQQRLSRLTPREREVLELVLAGRRNKQIAAELASQEATVKVHRSRLMRKLETRSLAELMRLTQEAVGRTGVAPRGMPLEPVARAGAPAPSVGGQPVLW